MNLLHHPPRPVLSLHQTAELIAFGCKYVASLKVVGGEGVVDGEKLILGKGDFHVSYFTP